MLFSEFSSPLFQKRLSYRNFFAVSSLEVRDIPDSKTSNIFFNLFIQFIYLLNLSEPDIIGIMYNGKRIYCFLFNLQSEKMEQIETGDGK